MSTLTVATEKRIASLNSQLEAARIAYYQDAKPIMEDAAYDLLEKELKGLIKANPELAPLAPVTKTVGSDLTSGGRVKHSVPMLSIENHYTEDDYETWYNAQNLDGNGVMCEEPKQDGISCSLTYENGKLIRALTRGDGVSGEDITAAVFQVRDIPKSLPSLPQTLEVRGELVMKNSTLARINAEQTKKGQKIYASTRNLTAGTMKQKDLSNISDRDIQIRPWDVLGNQLPDSRLERLRLIAKDGFPAPEGEIVTNREELISRLHQILAQNKNSDINKDGVVLKIDSVKACEALGVGSNYTNYQICYKEQSSKGVTYLREVVWQCGRSGKLTPVGILDPVTLAGAVITRVNLNNISYIREMNLKINSRVEVTRSGEVIPIISKVLD